jgi:hypothetical protein
MIGPRVTLQTCAVRGVRMGWHNKWRRRRHIFMVSLLPLALTGCGGTSRVDANITPAQLKTDNKAVAIMRIGSASPTCINVAVLLGRPEGAGYRRTKAINVTNVHSILEPAVAETELEAGEYHIIGYGCAKAKGVAVVAEKADGTLYAMSFASFKVEPGEIVNVGYLQFNVSHVGRNAIGRPIDIQVGVIDWPLNELERFKQKRPGLFAKMTTRLMTVTDRGPHTPTSDECGRLKALKAEGKVQSLPATCV